MTGYDLCANTVTFDDIQKGFVNDALWEALDAVGALYDQHKADGNIYIGGSVGLLQPALKCHDGRPVSVKSDLDLFYLCRNTPPKAEEIAFLESVSQLPDEVDISIHLMPAVNLEGSTYSLAFDDLSASLERPLRQGFPFAYPKNTKNYEDKTGVLTAVSIFANCFIPSYVSSHQYANLTGNRVPCDPSSLDKAAMMLLRVPTYGLLAENYSHRRLLELARDGFFGDVATPDEVLEVLTRREQVDVSRPPLSVSISQLFHRVFCRHLELPSETSLVEIASALNARYFSGANQLDAAHAFLLAFSLWLMTPDQASREFLRQQSPRCEHLPEHLSSAILLWLDKPTAEQAQELCGELKGLGLKSITDNVAALVAQAYHKSHQA